MTAGRHYQAAMRELGGEGGKDVPSNAAIARAQVHALLAIACAINPGVGMSDEALARLGGFGGLDEAADILEAAVAVKAAAAERVAQTGGA